MMQYGCILPRPPSVNNLYPTSRSGHRYPSKAYIKWRKAVSDLGLTYPEGFPVGTRWALDADFGRMPRRRDLDNYAKGLIDWLAEMTGLQDDHLDYLCLYRSGSHTTPEVVVRLWTLE